MKLSAVLLRVSTDERLRSADTVEVKKLSAEGGPIFGAGNDLTSDVKMLRLNLPLRRE